MVGSHVFVMELQCEQSHRWGTCGGEVKAQEGPNPKYDGWGQLGPSSLVAALVSLSQALYKGAAAVVVSVCSVALSGVGLKPCASC